LPGERLSWLPAPLLRSLVLPELELPLLELDELPGAPLESFVIEFELFVDCMLRS